MEQAYETRYAGLMDQVGHRLAARSPPDADPAEVARVITAAVDAPRGTPPYRVHIDPANDGAEEVNGIGDRVRRDFYQRLGLEDLLTPHVEGAPGSTPQAR